VGLHGGRARGLGHAAEGGGGPAAAGLGARECLSTTRRSLTGDYWHIIEEAQ
jgi:hypothetical protein